MKTGTKSLLFGVHQFIWHPITVWLAWLKLYGKAPTFKETICIIVHDWGYWGCEKMDDSNGERHPELGAKVAKFLLDKTERTTVGFNDANPLLKAGWQIECPSLDFKSLYMKRVDTTYHDLVLLHSRHLAHTLGCEPSKLCWPDKFSILFEPRWWYLLRANLSGEIHEYIANGERYFGRKLTQTEWFDWIKSHLQKVAKEKTPAMQSSSRLLGANGIYKV